MPPAETRTRSPREVRRREQLRDAPEDVLRLGHAPGARLALGQLALLGTDQLDSSVGERPDVRLRRGVRPHAVVHRRRDEHGPAVRERRLGEHVVRDPLRELRERVRCTRRDDEQIRVREVWIQILARGPPRERIERLRRDELLRAAGDDRHDVVPRLDEQPRQLAGLVGGDASGDA